MYSPWAAGELASVAAAACPEVHVLARALAPTTLRLGVAREGVSIDLDVVVAGRAGE